IRHVMDDTRRPNILMHMDMPGWSRTQGVYIQAKTHPFRKHTFNAKVDGFHNFIKADMTMYLPGTEPMYMLTWPGTDLYAGGLFLEDKIALNERSELDLKARLELT